MSDVHAGEKYHWRPSDANPHVSTRHITGVERYVDFLNRYVDGQKRLILAASIHLAHEAPSSTVLHATRHAWTALRFDVPIIACGSDQDSQGNSLLTYRAAASSSEAEAWAERTVRVSDASTLEQARTEILKYTLPDTNGDQTFIYVVPQSSKEYAIVLHTHHTVFDGTGAKVVMNRLLTLLARYLHDTALAAGELAKLGWGTESARLLPMAAEVPASSEVTHGPEYDKTVAGIWQDFVTKFPNMHGYKIRNVGPGVSLRDEHRFNEADSARIVAYAKSKGLTVNQLVHAAVLLSVVRDNSDVKDGAFLVGFGLVNSRDRLAAPYNERLGYPGLCLGVSPIGVAVSEIDQTGLESQLISMAEALKREYARQKAYPSLLSSMSQTTDMVLAAVAAAPPAPAMGPSFAGDGIGETYLDPTYSDNAGKESIRVTDFYVSLKMVQPGPFFRAQSWNKVLSVSADYNSHAMPTEVSEGLMQHVVEYLSVAL